MPCFSYLVIHHPPSNILERSFYLEIAFILKAESQVLKKLTPFSYENTYHPKEITYQI